jgi:hypothetical protein
MRVLIVNPHIYVYGGAELLIVKLANYLTKNNIENALLTTSILAEVEKDLKGTEIILTRNTRSSITSETMALHKCMSSNLKYYDVINVHNFPAEVAVFPFHKPVVWMCNEPSEIALEIEHTLSSTLKFKKKLLVELDKFVTRHYIKTQ